MASLQELVRQHRSMTPDQLRHLRRLTASWNLLADLGFADLLLFVPVDGGEGSGRRFVVVGQVRPATTQTLHRDDQFGRFVSAEERPSVAAAFDSGRPITGRRDEDTVVDAVPVVHDGVRIGVLTAERAASVDLDRGELERAYHSAFGSLVAMVGDGTFPFDSDEAVGERARVGDGVLITDRATRVTFSSPNAVSALHRLGVHVNAVGRSADDLGIHADVLRTAFSFHVPVSQEIERGSATTILTLVLPLIEQRHVSGALILVRDVSDLRRQERLLVSMDATIREIHHRVKNNLQTVSSLLRLQGRRLESSEAKTAIDESVRRISSIALVHEILAQDGGDDVRLVEVVEPITRMVEQALVAPGTAVRFRMVGDAPTLPASVSSSVAVVLTELLQNAVEHGYPPGSDGGTITIEFAGAGTDLVIRVHDDGIGLPAGFDLESSDGLGLTIARTLVRGDLGGTLSLRPATGDEGTIAEIRATTVIDPA